jgi:hypothetical protein
MKLKINHSHYIGRRHYEASNKNWNVKPNWSIILQGSS